MHFSKSRLSLEGGREMPKMREGDRFLVDLVEADEVEMVRGGCRAAEVWRVSELRDLDGAGLRGLAGLGDALERLVDNGKAGRTWGEVVRRVAQATGSRVDSMGRTVRVGDESRCSRPLDLCHRWHIKCLVLCLFKPSSFL